MNTLIAVLLAYLIGSVSFAVVVSWAFGLADPRTYGSRNPGATNVLRTGNRWAAAMTLLGDGAKGWLAVWLVQRYGAAYGLEEASIALVVLAVFIGHLAPVFFRFKGGKGVATALGVLIAIEPWLGVATLATWLIVAFFFRYSSLAALVASVFAPVYYVFGNGVAWAADVRIGTAMVFMSLLLVYRHRENIRKLLAGQESRIGQKKKG
jgi:glycerol-3-phosphate acyltransferase PlsY